MKISIDELKDFISNDKINLAGKITKEASYITGFPKTLGDWEIMKTNGTLPKLTNQIKDWFWRMAKASIVYSGIGVAATQIGIYKKMFVIQESKDIFGCYLHPNYVIDIDSKQLSEREGCLSVPGVYLDVKRETKILASWFDFDNNGELIYCHDLLEGFYARVFCHEHDHLIAKSIIDNTHEMGRAEKRSMLEKLR